MNKPSRYFNIFNRLIIISLILSTVFSCVENRKLIYLQKPKLNKGDYPYDSVISTYPLMYREYRLKPRDVISLRIGSITPEEYNFVKDYEEQLGEIRKLYQYQTIPTNIAAEQMNQQRMTSAQGAMSEEGVFSSVLLDRYRTGFMIDSRGELALPKIGVINFSGLTLEEAQDMVQEKLKGYFETPVVRIQLLSFYFTLMGEVKNEGRYIALDPKFNVFDAIAMGGSLNEFADRSLIKIVRQENNEAKIIYLNPLDENLLNAKNYYLQPGDMIIVPPLRARYYRKYVLPDTNTALALLTAVISIFLLIQTLKQ